MSKINDSMREFLNGRHYATLATLNEDGSIHLTPTWYLFEDERFFISTGASSRKARNLSARPEASIIVDIRNLASERWVSESVAAEIIRGDRSKDANARPSKTAKKHQSKAMKVRLTYGLN